jgi:hypothetical protein
VSAQSRDWKRGLERTLETSTYITSDVAAFDGNRITREGTAFVVKRPGLLASPARHLGAVNTQVRDGRVVQPGGIAALFSDRATRQFEVGDIVYLTDVEVRDNVVVLELLTRQIVPIIEKGTTSQMRYKGQVEFHFPEGFLRTVSAEDLREIFDEFLSPLKAEPDYD